MKISVHLSHAKDDDCGSHRNSDSVQSTLPMNKEQEVPFVIQREVEIYFEQSGMKNHAPTIKALILLIFLFASVVMAAFAFMSLMPIMGQAFREMKLESVRDQQENCQIFLVESIPEGLVYPPEALFLPTHEVWSMLINGSKSSINIASFYWSLRGSDIYPHPSAYQGEEIFKLLSEAANRNVTLNVVQNSPSEDTEDLQKKGNTNVRSLNFTKLLGGGVLHTKFWIVDGKHIYIGSANMDWRSLTQVKELGAVIYDCPSLAVDLMKVFNVYWDLGEENAVVPSRWPDLYSTMFNLGSPMLTSFGNTFFSSSPPPFSPAGRTNDDDAIVYLMSRAEKFIYISVMDYIPLIIYGPKVKFWPVLDNAIKTAAVDNRVNVRLLISKWKHTRRAEYKFLQSLLDLSGSYKNVNLEVKLFVVPATPDQEKIPFSRVNHNKYMVTDKAAYIGTSNWCGDYFIDTAGVGLVIQPNELPGVRDKLEFIFLRDWNSSYAKPLAQEDFSSLSHRKAADQRSIISED